MFGRAGPVQSQSELPFGLRSRLVRRQCVVLAADVGVGCAPPAAARQIEAAHAGATYEGTAQGCEWPRGSITRRFGRDISAAVLWGRQVFGTSRLASCEVRIAAVNKPAYRLRRAASGPTEFVLPER